MSRPSLPRGWRRRRQKRRRRLNWWRPLMSFNASVASCTAVLQAWSSVHFRWCYVLGLAPTHSCLFRRPCDLAVSLPPDLQGY